MIKGLHHNAYRCRDSEETRKFYQDFLGLPLANAFEITETKSGRATHVLHSFYSIFVCDCFRQDDGMSSRALAVRDDDHLIFGHGGQRVFLHQLDPLRGSGRRAGLALLGVLICFDEPGVITQSF